MLSLIAMAPEAWPPLPPQYIGDLACCLQVLASYNAPSEKAFLLRCIRDEIQKAVRATLWKFEACAHMGGNLAEVSPTEMSLCTRCKAITMSSLVSSQGHLLHENWSSLQESAPTCNVCRLFMEQLTNPAKPAYDPEPQTDRATSFKSLQYRARVPESWHASGTTPIVLKYHPNYVDGEERVHHKPTQGSSLWVTCTLVEANPVNGANGSVSRKESDALSKVPSEDVYVLVYLPIFVYTGALMAFQAGVKK